MQKGKAMRVAIIEDDEATRCQLVNYLQRYTRQYETEFQIQQFSDGIQLAENYRPVYDILLMDIRMQGMSGLDAAECILKEDQAAKILFLTTFSDDEYIVKALNMGAKGYLLKQDFESIVPALKAVYGGQSVFGGQIMGKIPVLLAGKGSFSYHDYDISEKEQGIIELVAEGLSNREIAEKLYLSEGTVRNYISTILDKLKLRDRTQLAVFYYKNCG